MSSIEINTKSILEQSHICDDIVENIDKIVPKLYKLRQQVQAQKNYINDMTSSLLNKIATDSLADVMTVTLDGNPLKINTTNISKIDFNSDNLRDVIQSIYKLKHDIGTPYHFNTSQMGTSENRTKGLNLIDVKTITSGLDDYLKLNSMNKDDNTNKCINKLFAPVAFKTETLIVDKGDDFNGKKIMTISTDGEKVTIDTTSGSTFVKKYEESTTIPGLQDFKPFGILKANSSLSDILNTSLNWSDPYVHQANGEKSNSVIRFGYNTNTIASGLRTDGTHISSNSGLRTSDGLDSSEPIFIDSANGGQSKEFELYSMALDAQGNVKPRRRQIRNDSSLSDFTEMVRGLGLVD